MIVNAVTQTPTQKLKNGFCKISSKKIRSSLEPFGMIFEALQFDLFHSLGLKILKIAESNLRMALERSDSEIY